MTPSLLEIAGPPTGPPLHFAPANSFPVGTYASVYQPLASRYRIV
jgi:hypothetical protein